MLRRRNPTLRKLRGSEVYWRQPTSATSVATRHRYLGCTPVRVTIYLEMIFGTTFGPSIQGRRTGLPRILSTLKPGCFQSPWKYPFCLGLCGVLGWLCWALISPLEVYSAKHCVLYHMYLNKELILSLG